MIALVALSLNPYIPEDNSIVFRNTASEYKEYLVNYASNNFSHRTNNSRTIHVPNKPDSLLTVQTETARLNDEYMFSVEVINEKNYPTKVDQHRVARNANYMYQATMGKLGKWVITKITIPAPTYYDSLQAIQPKEVSESCIAALNRLQGKNIENMNHSFSNIIISDIATMPNLKITKVDYHPEDIEFHVAFDREYFDWDKKFLTSGIVVVSKSNKRISSYKLESRAGDMVIVDEHKVISMRHSMDGVNIKSIASEKVYINNVVRMTINFEYNIETKFGTCNQKLFTLSKIGQSEPSVASNSYISLPWFVYLTFAGIICVLLAIFIIYRRNRQAAA